MCLKTHVNFLISFFAGCLRITDFTDSSDYIDRFGSIDFSANADYFTHKPIYFVLNWSLFVDESSSYLFVFLLSFVFIILTLWRN